MNRMPQDLQKVLKGKAKAAWDDLTPIGQRDFIRWITSAKQVETRARRVAKASDMLLSGKRRPCCYAVVPMDLYRALGESPKAKATWKTLTPDERRDFVAWVDEAKDMTEHELRVVKVCSLLSAGKRRP